MDGLNGPGNGVRYHGEGMNLQLTWRLKLLKPGNCPK